MTAARLRVVLVDSRNPLNIGAAARAMANFGFSALRVVNPYDVAFREARSAVGAGPVMQAAEVHTGPWRKPWPTARWWWAPRPSATGRSGIPLRRLEHGARLIRRHLASGNVALLFGSEKFGLSNEDSATATG